MSQEENLEDLRVRARDEFGIVNADVMSEEQLRSEVKALEDQPNSVDTQSDESTEDEATDSEPKLSDLKRSELEAKAEELGVEDPSNKETFPNKGALIAAIEDKNKSDQSE